MSTGISAEGFALGRKLAVALLWTTLAATGGSAAGPPLRCAILIESGPEGAAAVALPAIEQALLGMGGLTFVERVEVEEVLRERQLQGLFGPEAGRRRAEAGKLLKADILFLLRGAEKPKPHVDVVACETRGGLRLCNQSVPISEDIPAVAKRVEQLAEGAVRKQGEAIRGIFAAPPFVSNDLGYESDHLKSGYARLVEQLLLEREGVVVVELAEARSIGREQLLGGGEGVERRLPLYLAGEFRHDGAPGHRRAKISIALTRGETRLGTAERAGLAAEAEAGFVREAVARLVDAAIHTAPPPPDPSAEAKGLAARSATFERLENWDEAAALIEASLLLVPDQDDLRHRAVIVYGYLARRSLLAGGERTIDQVHAGEAQYFRGLEHLEAFLRAVGDLRPYREVGQTDFMWRFHHSTNAWTIWGHPTREVLDALEVGRKREQEALVRIARMRARAGRGDEAIYMTWAASGPPAETYDVLFAAIKDLLDVPGTAARVTRLATHGYSPDVLLSPEGRAFLDRVATLPDDEARAAAGRLKRQLPAFAEETARRRDQLEARLRPTPPDEGPQDVTFRRLVLPYTTADGRTEALDRFGGCISAGDGTDVFLAAGSLFRMRAKGRLEPIMEAGAPRLGVDAACFDGRFLWASLGAPYQVPALLVVDPQTGRSAEFTAADGLPAKAAGGPEGKFTPNTLAVAPVSPGKVCVAGYFGRTYLAIAGFSPGAGKSFQIFHEAREAPQPEDRLQWRRTTIRFAPRYLLPIVGKVRPDAPSETRILIGRDEANIDAWYHPLLVDPDRQAVEVLRDPIDPADPKAYSVHDGGLYWAWPDLKHLDPARNLKSLWRVGFPDFSRTLVARDAYQGRADRASAGIFPDRSVLAAERLFVAEKSEGPYRALSGITPNRAGLTCQLLPSHHYGLLLRTFDNALYVVEFRDRPGPVAGGTPSARPQPAELKPPR